MLIVCTCPDGDKGISGDRKRGVPDDAGDANKDSQCRGGDRTSRPADQTRRWLTPVEMGCASRRIGMELLAASGPGDASGTKHV